MSFQPVSSNPAFHSEQESPCDLTNTRSQAFSSSGGVPGLTPTPSLNPDGGHAGSLLPGHGDALGVPGLSLPEKSFKDKFLNKQPLLDWLHKQQVRGSGHLEAWPPSHTRSNAIGPGWPLVPG